ncbi:hypothetical protein BIV60_08465 [Bacillus sp. MUM 116]|uniref:hypothetical protein n=1 Tax=Bacillus sp. MUM 116 TaxID=1678002 RepID=UPI0008F59FD2|nr:hypothetical protein [Bacillus sp. MUM 116]OIK15573.1 hypothetical protein BIV60_08465 [Bacillus sp. MUM 116]
MKKTPLFMLLLILILAACSKQISLSGESKHWEGRYIANIDGNREDGNFIFGYKNANKQTEFKNLNVEIKNGLGKTVKNEEQHKGATKTINRSCSGCAVTDETQTLKVTIKWNEKYEETFDMKKKK